MLPGAGPTLGILNEKGDGEVALPLPKLLPMMTDALLGAVRKLGGSQSNIANQSGPPIQIINQGTIVGRNGMEEFADIVSRRIGRKYGYSTGGVY